MTSAERGGSASGGRIASEESASDVGQLSYASAGRELDAIIEEFETGVIDVDRLVDQLERATQIVDELDRRLRRTRMRVEELVPRLEAIGRGDERIESTEDQIDESLSQQRPEEEKLLDGNEPGPGNDRGPQGLF